MSDARGIQTLVEFIELQGSDALITKTELLDEVRSRGLRISDRNLSYYQGQGLLPPSVRVGTRTAAFPAIVAEMAEWVIRSRQRGLSIDAIRELLPVWKHLVLSRTRGEVSLAELEYQARSKVSSVEANYAIPGLVSDVLGCLCAGCKAEMVWLDKAGLALEPQGDITLGFTLAELDEITGVARRVAWTQLVLPGMGETPEADGPTTIVLGIPVGMPLPPACDVHRTAAQPSDDTAVLSEEVVQV